MSYGQWLWLASAHAKREREMKDWVTNLVKNSFEGLRELLIALLGNHIGVEQSGNPEDPTAFHPLIMYVGDREYLAEAFKRQQGFAVVGAEKDELDMLADDYYRLTEDGSVLNDLLDMLDPPSDPIEDLKSDEYQRMLNKLGIKLRPEELSQNMSADELEESWNPFGHKE